ncbi:hypothetical protein [Bradyrhizobium sp. SZCCHNR2032]|uniref:hypothetical protein n=1 Tax=Bradyrhizobium sp. SZCCHNR2032 TaxID=3057384 RepID=UPI002916C64D|nr:hypothetical protein [Bradyrhizobium sp. SZCCHNR2032]
MKYAVIEMTAEIVSQCMSVLVDAGLAITGSLDCGLREDGKFHTVRLMVKEEDWNAVPVLPAGCASDLFKPGFPVVHLTLQTEAYGAQRLTRIQSAEIVGHLVRDHDGKRSFKAVPRPVDPDIAAAIAKARAEPIRAGLESI